MMYSSGIGHMWGGPLAYGVGGGVGFIFGFFALLAIAIFIALKGYALWLSAKRDQKWWFIVLLVVNTAGILEIIYIVFFAKKWHKKYLNKAGHTGEHHDHSHHNA